MAPPLILGSVPLVGSGGGGGGGPPLIHTGSVNLVSAGDVIARDDSTSSLTYLPVPPSYSVGDFLLGITCVACIPNPSIPDFQPFPGGYYSPLMFLRSYIVDPNFGDLVITTHGRIADGTPDDALLALRGQARPRWGQIVAFSGMPATLTNITVQNGLQEQGLGLGTQDVPVITGVGAGTDTLGMLAFHRLGNNPLDHGILPSGDGWGSLPMEVLATVNIPSAFGSACLIGGWAWKSRGEIDSYGGGTFGTTTYADNQRTGSCYQTLKAANYG
jgi:hypothetical protein